MREKRQSRFVAVSELTRDIQREASFERMLQKTSHERVEGVFNGNLEDWRMLLNLCRNSDKLIYHCAFSASS